MAISPSNNSLQRKQLTTRNGRSDASQDKRAKRFWPLFGRPSKCLLVHWLLGTTRPSCKPCGVSSSSPSSRWSSPTKRSLRKSSLTRSSISLKDPGRTLKPTATRRKRKKSQIRLLSTLELSNAQRTWPAKVAFPNLFKPFNKQWMPVAGSLTQTLLPSMIFTGRQQGPTLLSRPLPSPFP